MTDGDTKSVGGDSSLPGWIPSAKLGLTLLASAFAAPGMRPEVQSAALAVSVIPAFLDYLQDASGRAWAKVQAMSTAASDTFAGPSDELLTALERDERLLWMLDSGIDAAAQASTTAKARTIGRALAAGALAADDAQIDEAAQMLRIIADLEPIDVRVLDQLSRFTEQERQARPVKGDVAPSGIRANKLAVQMPGLSVSSVRGAMAVLERHGLAETSGRHYAHMHAHWIASDLGDSVLRHFIEASRI